MTNAMRGQSPPSTSSTSGGSLPRRFTPRRSPTVVADPTCTDRNTGEYKLSSRHRLRSLPPTARAGAVKRGGGVKARTAASAKAQGPPTANRRRRPSTGSSEIPGRPGFPIEGYVENEVKPDCGAGDFLQGAQYFDAKRNSGPSAAKETSSSVPLSAMTMQRPANVAVVGGSQLHKQHPGPPPGFGHHRAQPEQVSHEEMGGEPRDSECEGHSAVDSSFVTSMSSTEHLKATLGIKCGDERDLLDESMDDAYRGGGKGVSGGGVGNCGIQRRLIDAFEEMALAEDDEDEESSQKKPRSSRSCSPVFQTDAVMADDSLHQQPLPAVPSAPRKAAPKSASITIAASTDNDNEGDVALSANISPTCVSELDAAARQQQQVKKDEAKAAKDFTSADNSEIVSSEQSNLQMDTSDGFDSLEEAEEGKTHKGTHPAILTEMPPSPSRSSSSGSQGSTSSGSTVAPIPVRAVDSPLRHQQEGGEPTYSGGDSVQTPPRPPMSCPLVTAAKCSSPPTVNQHPAMTRLNDFELHESLRLELSQPLINRVSFYGVVHDINKEAASMAAEDHSAFHRRTVEREQQQQAATLQAQANNKWNKKHGAAATAAPAVDDNTGGSMADSALIDEEEWLVSVVANRSTEETSQIEKKSTAAASFAYAIGDAPDDTPPSEVVPTSTSLPSGAVKPGTTKQQPQQQPSSETTASGDKPNPIGEINGSSRTRLWKPSRSWWEARSGKNPWIDPENHVKRWRYLWPLIHYHKFLAKCIKKLKRHGVTDFLGPDTSPVISFLRHEIVAVSDHLAACSKFTSEEWLACLTYFDGWNDTSPEAQECLSVLVARQKLRSFAEPSDPRASPLVRKVLRSYGNDGDRYFGQGGGKGSDKRNGVNGRNKMNRRGGGAPMAYHPSWANRAGYPPYPPPTHHAAMHNYYYYHHHQMQQQYYAGMGAAPYGPPPSGGGPGSMMPPRQPRSKKGNLGTGDGLPPSSSMRSGRGKKNASKQHFRDGGVGAAYPPPGYGEQNYYPPPVPSSHPQPPMPLYPSEDQYYSHPSGHVVPQYMDASMYPTDAGSSSYPPSSTAPPYSYHYGDVHPPSQHNHHGHHDAYHPHEEFYRMEQVDPDVSYSHDEGDQWLPEEPPLSRETPVYDDADHSMDAGIVPPSPYHCGAPAMVSPSPGTYPIHSPMPHRGEGGVISAETPTLQMQRSFDGSVAPSPYWGHLDQVALAVTMGDGSFIVDGTAPRGPGSSMMVMTPDTSRHGTPKGTPKRVSSKQQRRSKRNNNQNANPLLFNPAIAHHQRVHGGRERCQPPSPATQFLMSSQQNFLPTSGFYAAYGGAEGSKSPIPKEDAAPTDGAESSSSSNKEEKDDAIPYTGATEADPRPLMSGAPCVSPIQEQDHK